MHFGKRKGCCSLQQHPPCCCYLVPSIEPHTGSIAGFSRFISCYVSGKSHLAVIIKTTVNSDIVSTVEHNHHTLHMVPGCGKRSQNCALFVPGHWPHLHHFKQIPSVSTSEAAILLNHDLSSWSRYGECHFYLRQIGLSCSLRLILRPCYAGGGCMRLMYDWHGDRLHTYLFIY